MAIQIVLETHSTSVDNERGAASGWNDPPLSALGRTQAAELGARRRMDGIQVVFASDLRRAEETAQIAFGETGIPILRDWRLRECDYGAAGGSPTAQHHRTHHLYVDTPYPGGESWRQAVARVGWFLDDLPRRWACEHLLNGVALEELCAAEFVWQPGWEYRLA